MLQRHKCKTDDIDQRPELAIGQEHRPELLRDVVLDVVLFGAADEGETDDEEDRLFVHQDLISVCGSQGNYHKGE
jgi:hypothetical protein